MKAEGKTACEEEGDQEAGDNRIGNNRGRE